MPEMTLSLWSGSPCLSHFPHSSSPHLSQCWSPSTNTALLSILLCNSGGSSSHCPPAPHHLRDSAAPPPAVSRRSSECRAWSSKSESSVTGKPSSSSSAILSDEVVGEASGARDVDEALRIIVEKAGGRGGVVGVSDCCLIMAVALERDNAGLALSMFYTMCATFDQGPGEDSTYVYQWRWSRPDGLLYATMATTARMERLHSSRF